MLKNTKIRVENPTQSEKVQKKLFSMGYYWSNSLFKISHTEKHFLFINDKNEIVYSDCESFYKQKDYNEIDADFILSIENTFKAGDNVFDFRYGWGVVIKNKKGKVFEKPLKVEFDGFTRMYTFDGKAEYIDKEPILSFAEYTIEGFSKVDYNSLVGKWGVFSDELENRNKAIIIDKLKRYESGNNKHRFVSRNYHSYRYFEPLNSEQLKSLKICQEK